MPRDVVERVADRQRMQHGAARRAPNGGCRRRARGRCRASATVEPATSTEADDQLARRAGRRRPRRMTDSSCSRRSARRGRRPGAPPPRPSARSTTAPAFMPRASGVAEAEDLDGVAAPAQHVLRRLRLAAARSGRRSCWCRRRARRPAPSACGDSGFIFGREAVLEGAHASPPFFFGFLSLSASCARLRGRVGQPHRHAVGQAADRSATMSRVIRFLLAVERDQPLERAVDVGLRQPHVDAVLQPQVPAPLADQDRGAHLVAQRGIAVEQREEILGPRLGAAADHQRQPRQLRRRRTARARCRRRR